MLNSKKDINANSKGLNILIAAAVISLILYNVPFGGYITYPFFILCTWFHEMGHGIAALLMGGNINHIVLQPSGSGLTQHSHAVGNLLLGQRLSLAFIAAAGLVVPPIIGAMFIVFSKRKQGAKMMLWILVGFIVVGNLLWVRNLFGWVMMALVGAFVVLVLLKGSLKQIQFLAKFIGVQAALATFLNWRYLFAYLGGSSDVAHIQHQLFLPYWFWGGAIAVFSALLLIASLRWAYRS